MRKYFIALSLILSIFIGCNNADAEQGTSRNTNTSVNTNKIKPKKVIMKIITFAGAVWKRRFSGDGGPATKAGLNRPHNVFVHKGYVYIADTLNNAIRRVPVGGGNIETIAGGNGAGYSGDGGLATKARLAIPTSLFVDDDYVYIVGFASHAVRRFKVGGKIETIAGGNGKGYRGDGRSARRAKFNKPHGVFVYKGYVYVADTMNHAIRRFKIGGKITTIAGGRGKGFNGNNKLAVKTKLGEPVSVYVHDGYVYIAEYYTNVVRRFKVGGRVEKLAGGNGVGYTGDGRLATKAKLRCPHAALYYKGYVYIADMNNHAIRRFKVGGNIETVAGGNGVGHRGDGGHPRRAKLSTPAGFHAHNGYIYIAEYGNNDIRRCGLPQ